METLQRRVISEDTVQYKLFLVQTDDPSSQQTEEHLTQLAEQILANVAPLLIQSIWQNQPFNLRYHSEKGTVKSVKAGWFWCLRDTLR